jgi:mono/diheme cytochrome c family protein
MFRLPLSPIFLFAGLAMAQPVRYGLGRAAAPDEVRAANITILPNGTGLPSGKGTAQAGEAIFKSKCVLCHNGKGAGRKNEYPALAGGIGSLGTAAPRKTVGSYWPYATTVFDHINRAMPFNAPHTLPANDVYAVTAYILYLNGIVQQSQEMNEKTLPKVVMPNRNGFVQDTRPDIRSKR